ncbi:hypothetical protein [uncultured Microbacterium sp.]|uniref:hypothetical protein n=1 Tax=uncultured Microbacterium sp. TaxID=191216 RepID=UPI0028E41DAE|nr:hypothetical protein [uncultured Microbacterium sp.]
MQQAETSRPRLLGRALPAVVVVLVTWLLLWLAQGVPTVCALAFPCPTPDVRVAPALLFGGLLLVPTAVLLLTSGSRHGRSGVRAVAWVLLVGLAVVGLGAVLFSGGFSIGVGR